VTFQILSLSGGGFLGLYSAAVLTRLEAELGGAISDRFDLIAGTSIGGIIGLGLANGASPAEILAKFKEKGPKIFSTRKPAQSKSGQALELLKNTCNAKYDAAPLKEAITELIGADRRVGHLKKRVMVPAINLTKGRPQVFKTAHHGSFRRDFRLHIADVALATSAAPTFFPAHSISDELFTDGGLYANSPDQLALHEAIHFLDIPFEEIRMLSIGTTTSEFSFSHATSPNMGWMDWMSGSKLLKTTIAAQQINCDAMMKHVLGDNYIRIDKTLSPDQCKTLSLDTAGDYAMRDLEGLAEASVRELKPEQLQVFRNHQAPVPQLFHTMEGEIELLGAD